MVVIKNAVLATMGPDGILQHGMILIDRNKIEKCGETFEIPRDTFVIDANGAFIMPGIIDAHTHIGVFETGTGPAGIDGNESCDPITPHIRGLDGVNPFDCEFSRAVKSGVTTVVTGPGSSNPIGGQFLALKTSGRTFAEQIIKAPVAMKMAFGENPKNVYGEKQIPSTRMGVAALIRETLYKACEYQRKKEYAGQNPDKEPPFDMRLEALIPVVNGILPVKAHAHRADDILTAIRIAEEFRINMTIEHCTEGYLIASELAEKNIKVILGPYLGFPHKNENMKQDESAAGILEKAGVKVAIMTDLPAMHEESLVLSAAVCYRKGMSMEGALKAITIHAAEAVQLEKNIGSIEQGKDADLAFFRDNPILNPNTMCIGTMINGEFCFRNSEFLR